MMEEEIKKSRRGEIERGKQRDGGTEMRYKNERKTGDKDNE